MSARSSNEWSAPPRRFSRAWLADSLRTLAWVALITLLIWVYADIQFPEERDVSATLQINTQWNGQPVVLEAPVEFRVKGNHYSIEKLAQGLSAANSVIGYSPARQIEPKDELPPTIELLPTLPIFRGTGVQIVSARPMSIQVGDALRVFPGVPLKPDSTGAVLDGEPVLEPSRVDLRIPVNVKFKPESVASLSIRPPDIRSAAPGEPHVVEAEVLPPPDLASVAGVRITPPKVRAVFRVKEPIDTKSVPVVVVLRCPPKWMESDVWGQYKLVVQDPEQWKFNVLIQGPSSLIRDLKAGADSIQAYVTLLEGDEKPISSWLDRVVSISIAPGLKVTVPTQQEHKVSFKLVKRTEPAGGP